MRTVTSDSKILTIIITDKAELHGFELPIKLHRIGMGWEWVGWSFGSLKLLNASRAKMGIDNNGGIHALLVNRITHRTPLSKLVSCFFFMEFLSLQIQMKLFKIHCHVTKSEQEAKKKSTFGILRAILLTSPNSSNVGVVVLPLPLIFQTIHIQNPFIVRQLSQIQPRLIERVGIHRKIGAIRRLLRPTVLVRPPHLRLFDFARLDFQINLILLALAYNRKTSYATFRTEIQRAFSTPTPVIR